MFGIDIEIQFLRMIVIVLLSLGIVMKNLESERTSHLLEIKAQ